MPRKTADYGTTDYGTTGSIDKLLVRTRTDLGRILARFRVPPEDADDLVQDVLVHYLHKRRQVRDPERWLKGALRKQCQMYWRSRRRRITVAVDETLLELVAERRGPRQEQRLLRRNLSRLIDSLQWRCREMLRLRYHLGYDRKEIAVAMGYKRSSIDKIARRCLDALASRLIAASHGLPTRKES